MLMSGFLNSQYLKNLLHSLMTPIHFKSIKVFFSILTLFIITSVMGIRNYSFGMDGGGE